MNASIRLALSILLLASSAGASPAAAQSGADDRPVPQCMFKPIPEDGLESICGTDDDSVDVNSFRPWGALDGKTVHALSGAIGLLAWKTNARDLLAQEPGKGRLVKNGKGRCSGVLIAPTLFLTAAHCVSIYQRHCAASGSASQIETCRERSAPHRTVEGKRTGRPPADVVTAMTVRFGFEFAPGEALEGTPSGPIQEFAIRSVREIGPEDGPDYAILELVPNPAGNAPGDLFGTRGELGTMPGTCDQIAIIHHPSGRPKRVSTGKVMPDAGRLLYNDLDTENVSSGAPAFNMAGELIGVHASGGCSEDPLGPGRGFNWGYNIDSLLPHSDILRSLQ